MARLFARIEWWCSLFVVFICVMSCLFLCMSWVFWYILSCMSLSCSSVIGCVIGVGGVSVVGIAGIVFVGCVGIGIGSVGCIISGVVNRTSCILCIFVLVIVCFFFVCLLFLFDY